MREGTFEIGDGVVVRPGMRESDFVATTVGRQSSLAPDRLPFRRYDLACECEWGGRSFIVSVVFKYGVLYALHLCNRPRCTIGLNH